MRKILFLLSIIPLTIILITGNTYRQRPQVVYEGVSHNNIHKATLSNGLEVFVKPTKNVDNVSVELWYKVGSRDEANNQRGIAHLLEHTVFQGTKSRSETDIINTMQKLSGYCNAVTNYDTTHYIIELPKRHWQEALPIHADCMTNCTLKSDLLNSELKVVLTELKMRRDNYDSELTEAIISSIFTNHPYGYPIIGTRQNICDQTSETLLDFYNNFYAPNNACLFIVGDVDPINAIEHVKINFGSIPPKKILKQKECSFNDDISAKTIKIYRDVKQPKVSLAFKVSGLKHNSGFALNMISRVLCNGTSSRLYQKLVHELYLVNNINSYIVQLFDHGVFFINFEPKNVKSIKKIISIIKKEILKLKEDGISQTELKRLINSSKIEYCKLLKNNSDLANVMAQSYLATGDANLFFDSYSVDPIELEKQIDQLLKLYFTTNVMHTAYLLPLSSEDKLKWQQLQEESDKEDQKILKSRIRTSKIEEPKISKTVMPKPFESFEVIEPEIFSTKNGIKIFAHNDFSAPIISMILSLPAENDYECGTEIGLYELMMSVISKGTLNSSGKQISEELESMGTELTFSPEEIKMTALASQFERSLEILNEILINPTFDDNELQASKKYLLEKIECFWDEQRNVADLLIYENAYKNHPFGLNCIRNPENIANATTDDLVEIYKKVVTPKKSRIAIAGDLSGINIQTLLDNKLGSWTGPDIKEFSYPKVEATKFKELKHTMNRDQVLLAFAGLSIDRKHSDFDKLSLFNQLFNRKLFKIRMQSGICYSISGSVVQSVKNAPGLCYLITYVSPDKLKEAEELISDSLNKIIDCLSENDLEDAIAYYANSLKDKFNDNESIVSNILELDSFDLPFDYYVTKLDELKKITVDEVKTAVRKVLNPESMIRIKIGRVD